MTAPSIALTAPVGPEGAPLVVLGPSLGTSTILWEQVMPQLAQRYRVVAWDLPGHDLFPQDRRRAERGPEHDEGSAVGADRSGERDGRSGHLGSWSSPASSWIARSARPAARPM